MKIIIFGGTPGSGKTSMIKCVISELINDYSIHYIKFDVLNSSDDELIKNKYEKVSSEKKLSGEVCPDHYTALEIPKVIRKNYGKDILIIETAGLCLRCSPYVNEGLAINVLNNLAGKPSSYGPLLSKADIVAVTKGDLLSQAEREIFRAEIIKINPSAKIIEANGLTGEGGIDIANFIRETPDFKDNLTLKHSMPTAICGYCYGNKVLNDKETALTFKKGKELKAKIPNINCGKCGFSSCNEFVRAVINNEIEETQCIYLNKKHPDAIPCNCNLEEE